MFSFINTKRVCINLEIKILFNVCETPNNHLNINRLRNSVTNRWSRDANQPHLIESIVYSDSLRRIKGSEASVRLWFLSSGKLHLTTLNIIKSPWDSRPRAAAGCVGAFRMQGHKDSSGPQIFPQTKSSGQNAAKPIPNNIAHLSLLTRRWAFTIMQWHCQLLKGRSCVCVSFYPVSPCVILGKWQVCNKRKLNWITAWDHVLVPVGRTPHTARWQYRDYRGRWRHSA